MSVPVKSAVGAREGSSFAVALIAISPSIETKLPEDPENSSRRKDRRMTVGSSASTVAS